MQRNEVVNGLEFSPYKVFHQAMNLALDMQIPLDQFGVLRPNIVNGRWTKPPPGYLKLNVDGSFCDGRAAFGGVLHDHHGMWIWGFAGVVNLQSALAVKLHALNIGLRLLMQRNCSCVFGRD